MLSKKYNFNLEEIEIIKKRFDKFAEKGYMSRKNFRESLGILGLEHAPFLSDRFFELLDSDHDGFVNISIL